MIKAVIFDVDGVILDTNKAYARVFINLFRKYGIKVRIEDIYQHFGENAYRILQEFFHKHYVKNVFMEYKKTIGSKEFNKKVKLMPKVKRTISELKRRKLKIALASGALRIALYPGLGKFGLVRNFNLILSADSVNHGKPDPEMLNKIMRKLKVKPHETLYVGDTPTDIRMARRAHVKVVIVTTGVLKRKEAQKSRSDFVISDLTELIKIVNQLNIKQ